MIEQKSGKHKGSEQEAQIIPGTFTWQRKKKMAGLIYKIATKDDWQKAQSLRRYNGAEIDLKDGFIHFSTADQVRETAAKHFAGQDQLLLVAIKPENLGDDLKWEVSRGGDLFPHLYAPLKLDIVDSVVDLPLGSNGSHAFPEGLK